ncbi:MAG: hypothetical protein C0459_05695 [Chitinophaga sp.]|jgi:phage shock protein PspC (stress-responsive transcriptional regulator)/heme/copper-type cytochrome/quinol oxidase subunit 2|nr:hypothetical protein [Chitinophaga sp.]
MKKVININFQGRVVPIEESAYDILKKYVESLRNFFANEEGRDEIINDIEGRIAELFSETLKKGSTCITDDDVNTIIASIGRPEDFDGEEANVKSQLGGEQKQTYTNANANTSQQTYTSETNRRLYRDENNKVLGGVCSGLANYFGIDPTVVRILAVIFFGPFFLPYLILWVVIPSTATKVIGSQRKRLYRDTDDKVIAGVCSGLAQYFHVSVWLPRIIFLIPFFSFVFNFGRFHIWNFPDFMRISFSPGSAFIYIILWLLLPEAKTAAEKLEMKGEKVDLNSIKNTIQSDLEGFGTRAKKWGEEVGAEFSQKAKQFSAEATEKSKQFSAEATTVARKHSRGLGDIIVVIFKIFAYFILGSILFAIVCALFAVGVVITGLIPAWSFVISDGWQTILAWGTLVLFVWVPVIGIVTWIIRRLTGKKGNSSAVRIAFGGLWTIGWFCVIFLMASLSKEFRYHNNPVEENISLPKSNINQLEVKMNIDKYEDEDWYRLQPFISLDEDTAYVRNVKVQIAKSKSDSFSVQVVKLASGRNRTVANDNASKIEFSITQTDSVLNLGKGIALNRRDKFHNQHIIVTVYVPVGKKIKLNHNLGWDDHVYVSFGRNEWNWWNWENEEGVIRNWSHDVWYVMNADGKIKRTDKVEENENKSTDDEQNDAIENFKKSKEEIKKQREQKLKELNEIDKQLNQQEKADSNKYRYQPEKPKKAEPKQTAMLTVKKANMDFSFGMQSLLMARFL